jgi:hypothetical protein
VIDRATDATVAAKYRAARTQLSSPRPSHGAMQHPHWFLIALAFLNTGCLVIDAVAIEVAIDLPVAEA